MTRNINSKHKMFIIWKTQMRIWPWAFVGPVTHWQKTHASHEFIRSNEKSWTSKLVKVSISIIRQQKLFLKTDASPPPRPDKWGEFKKSITKRGKFWERTTNHQQRAKSQSQIKKFIKSFKIKVLFPSDLELTKAIIIKDESLTICETECDALHSGQRWW